MNRLNLLMLLFFNVTVLAQDEDPVGVRVATVVEEYGAESIWLIGDVSSATNSRLSAEIPGRLVTLLEKGDVVEAGEVVAGTNKELLRLQIDELKAEEAALKIQVAQSSKQVARLSRLLNSKAVADQEFDEMNSNYEVFEHRLQAVRSRLLQLQYRLRNSQIKAPFKGIVVERMAQPGEWLEEGDEVVRLLEIGRRRVELNAPIWMQPQIQVNDELMVRFGERTIMAPVLAVVPPAFANEHQIQIILDVSRTQWAIGSQVEIALPSGRRISHLMVPHDALVVREEMVYVMVIGSENRSRKVIVKLGKSNAETIQVSGHLEAGDQVVVRGAEGLQDEQAVRLLASGPGGS